MNRQLARFLMKKYHMTHDAAEAFYVKTSALLAVENGDLVSFSRRVLSGQAGVGKVESIIMIFIAIVIIYQLIPNISSSNTTVQNTANVSIMAKFAAGLGEWMFPLLGIVAVVFLLFTRGKKGTSL